MSVSLDHTAPLAVDMLSEFDGLSPLSFDIPLLPDITPPRPQEDPPALLDFDDILDIAREFEFARAITHVWPCEQDPCTCTDDILAAIVPTAKTERPTPSRLPSSPPITVPLETDDVQGRSGTGRSITSTLQGWSPPNGSQFLELDDALLSPPSTMSLVASPGLPLGGTDQAPTADPALDDTELKGVPTSTQFSMRSALVPVQTQVAQAKSKVSSRTGPHTTKPRPSSALRTGGTATANYARAPKGGIPPHIARSVTKANILRVEKERKVMQDAFSSMTTNETTKPSVLRRTVKAERETSKLANGRDCGKKPLDGDKEQRSAKRVRV